MIKKFLTKKSKIRIYIIYFEDALLYNYLLKNVNTKYYNKRLEGVYMKLNENINNIQNQDILQGLSKEEVDKRVARFERFMNGEVIGQKKLIRNYSAGNKQKIGIISAMLHQPQVLILDEPFNFLDPSSQSIIKHLLKAYNEETGATILVSSHNLNHTVDICPRIALLENGKIIRDIDNKGNSAEKELEDYFNVTE